MDVALGPQGRLHAADRQGFVWRLDTQGRPDLPFDGALPGSFVPLRVVVDCQGRTYLVGQDLPGILIMDAYGKLLPGPDQLAAAMEGWLLVHIPEVGGTDPRAATFDEQSVARSKVLPPELSQMLDVDLKRSLDQAAREQAEPKTREEVWRQIRDAAYQTVLPAAYTRHLPQFLAQTLPVSP